MDVEAYWDLIDRTVKPTVVAWPKQDLGSSLKLIAHANIEKDAAILDVGCAGSSLFDDLLELGYTDLTCMDVSGDAYDTIRQRLAKRANEICCVTADVTQFVLPTHSLDLWHDHAVFYLLNDPTDRERYLRNLRTSLRIGGYLIMGVVSDESPRAFVGSEPERYSVARMRSILGSDFELLQALNEDHVTAFGTQQNFIYTLFRHVPE